MGSHISGSNFIVKKTFTRSLYDCCVASNIMDRGCSIKCLYFYYFVFLFVDEEPWDYIQFNGLVEKIFDQELVEAGGR